MKAFIVVQTFADIENTENWELFFHNLLCAGAFAPLLKDFKVSG